MTTLPSSGIGDSFEHKSRFAASLIIIGVSLFVLNISTKLFEPIYGKLHGWVDGFSKEGRYGDRKRKFEKSATKR